MASGHMKAKAEPSMYINRVPQHHQWKLDEVIDFRSNGLECHIGEIAKCMYEWQGDVSTALKLTQADVASILTKHPGELNLQSRAVLRLWKEKMGMEATYRNLIIAFVKAEKQTYAEAICRVLDTDETNPPLVNGSHLVSIEGTTPCMQATPDPRRSTSNVDHDHHASAAISETVIDPVGRTIEIYVSKIIAELKDGDIVKTLGVELYKAKLISSSTLEDVRDVTFYHSSKTKAIMLLAVKETVASHHHMFDTFLTVLSKTVPSATMLNLVGKMRETLKLEKIKRQGACGSRKLPCISPVLPKRKKIRTECNPITAKCVSFLKSYYTRRAKAVDMKYPYKCPKEYINLALIRRDNLTKRQVSDLTNSSIHGNIDDIIDATSKSRITMDEIALPNEDGSLPTLILIMGAPGVGKSVFAWKLAQQWAKGVLLQDYSIVILLRARDSKVQNATNLFELLYFVDVHARESLVKDITDINGSGVLFILDGYDELHTSKREFFDKFLHGEVLPGATVLVTSRPSASNHILTQCPDISQHVEILGFTKENIQSYTDTAMPDHKMRESFSRYLSCYPHIHSAMYIPLNCVFVTQMYKENWEEENESNIILKTMSELYTLLVLSHLLRDRNCKRLKAIEDVPNYDKFLELCHFAYENILKNKIVFSDDELPPELEHFSLMQTEQDLYIGEGFSASHNFIHLTVQEYLAAFYVSKQSKELQKSFVKEHMDNSTLNVVIKFLAGLTKLSAFDELSLKDLICPMEGDKRTISVESLHILFEIQDTTVIKCTLNENLEFRHIGYPHLTPYDFYVLGFCIANSSAMWDLLLWTTLTEEAAILFYPATLQLPARRDKKLKQVVEKHGCRSLYMQGVCRLSPHTFQSLLKVNIFKEMTSLSLRNAGLNTESCIALSKGILSLCQLQFLDLDGNPNLFTQGGEEELVSSLILTNTVQNLLLEVAGVRNGRAIARLLEHCTSLTSLDCDANRLSVQETRHILVALHNSVNMIAVALSEADLSGNNCELLAHVLKNKCHHLQRLYINKCSIDAEGAVHLAKALCINESLRLLHISANHIGRLGAESFANMLKINSTLTKLMISDQSMGAEGVRKLMDSLPYNNMLKEIDLPITFEAPWRDYVHRSTLKINWIYENHSFSMTPD